MRQMNTEKLFDEGEYMVVYLYPETVKLDERQFFLWNLEEMSTVSNGASCEGIPGYRYKSCFYCGNKKIQFRFDDLIV